ncbi:MAG TPA: ribosome biogenesis GTPase Der [Kofleriaceae bacterium]|nr:ribosome biogenesis GTPase Der [Kofleriaceae bacterium]
MSDREIEMPQVAIVGRPNVGKSTLYNRLVGGRPALVHDTPGLTRDRRYGTCEYFGKEMRVVDTGGLDPEAEADVVGAGIHRQAWRAIDESDLVMLVVDATTGVTPLDSEIAKMLRKTGKPIVLVANKVDSPKRDAQVAELHRLGLGEPWAVSAAHGRGIDAMLETIVGKLSFEPKAPEAPEEEIEEEVEDEEPRALRVAFVGKPNAGKSSLTNRLVGEERSLVHHVPGTTTDPVDTPFTMNGVDYLLIDTAGIRRRSKVDVEIEKIAVSMAHGQIQRADVCVLVIDASLGPSEQDARLAGAVEEAGRGLVIALNKSDLVKGAEAEKALRQQIKDTFHFLDWAPVAMLSASRGDGTDKLMDLVARVAREHAKRVATAELNRFFAEVVEVTPPPLHHGRAVRIHYITQGGTRPPTILLWANTPGGVSPAYRRFLVNQLRKRYGFRGTPIRIVVKQKSGDRHKPEKMAPKKPRRQK